MAVNLKVHSPFAPFSSIVHIKCPENVDEKTKTFSNGFKSAVFGERIVLETLRLQLHGVPRTHVNRLSALR